VEEFYSKCRQHGLKITPQRVAVYRILKLSSHHPSADMIHRELKKEYPNISLDTVNRTLVTFAQIQLIDIVEGQGDPRRFDPNLETHHHFYCLGCNEIFDFYDDRLTNIKLPKAIEKKFNITGKRICLTGFCDKCGKPN